MKGSKNEWYYTQLGHRRGPVGEDVIRGMIVSQELHLDDAKVWKEGMDDWVNVKDVKCFKVTVKGLKPNVDTAAERSHLKETEARERDEFVGGMGRLGFNLYFYVGWAVLFFVVMIAIRELQILGLIEPREVDESQWIRHCPYVVTGLVTLYVAGLRMKNAGYPMSFGLGLFLPFVNFWVMLVGLCAPKNFRIRKRVGAAGMFLFLLFLGVIFCGVLAATKGRLPSMATVVEKVMGHYSALTNASERYGTAVQERAERRAQDLHDPEQEGRKHVPTKRDLELREPVDSLK